VRVKVRALIVHEGLVAVHRESRAGEPRLALPGGRVNRWETVSGALARELREELGVEVEADRLLYVCEVVREWVVHDFVLVFLAHLREPRDAARLELVDPSEAAGQVLPPILDRVAADLGAGLPQEPRWLGNVWSER
jgi:ADP-ribose pyrophosphatase YjhB (NUDIX family)